MTTEHLPESAQVSRILDIEKIPVLIDLSENPADDIDDTLGDEDEAPPIRTVPRRYWDD